MPKKKEKKIKVTQVKSIIGQKPQHKKTIEALGLKHIGYSREFIDTPQIRGMVKKIVHMVSWEEVK